VSRASIRVFVIGLVLVAIGLLVSTVEPSVVGTALVVAGLLILAPTWFLIDRAARRSPGWTRAWNPGAARREWEAGLAVREPERPLDDAVGDARAGVSVDADADVPEP
jgi:hypothetical protein